LQLERNGAGYEGEILANELERRIQHGSAVIRRSLFDAGNRVGLSDSLLLDLAEVFRWDIDFALDIRNGDAFTVIYEAFYRDGDKVRNGDILAAEFVNRGEAHRAVRYSNDAQQADYYDPQGRSMRKAFLRSPVDFTRVSSNFNPNRLHPTLGERRPHMGTDYAASPGTPIKATGNGQVIHRGWKGGYGRTVVVQHGGRYTTLYAHMSRYRASVTAGDHVSQGQVIGYVGSSGRSTGPHLHYEFRVNGEHRNPRTVNLPNAKPIPDHLRQDFEDQTQSRLAELDMYSRFRLAAQGELAR
jgi:murein DD-endopeptidase MepM/ murein hydrolase activator NlpD